MPYHLRRMMASLCSSKAFCTFSSASSLRCIPTKEDLASSHDETLSSKKIFSPLLMVFFFWSVMAATFLGWYLSFFRRSRHGNGKTSHLLDRYSSMLMHFEPSVRLFSTPNGLHCIISCFLRVRNHPDSKGNSDVPQYPAAQICKDVTVIGMYVYIVCVCIRMYVYIYTIIIYIYMCAPPSMLTGLTWISA